MKIVEQKEFNCVCDNFFNYLTFLDEKSIAKLIIDCYSKYSGNKGANFVMIKDWEMFSKYGKTPPRNFMTVQQFTTQVIIPKKDQELIVKSINDYKPLKEVLFVVICPFDDDKYRVYIKKLEQSN